MPISEGESYLIDAVQRGDADAWREVIARYQGRLTSFARRMLAQPSEAEDLVQDTFLGFVRSLPTFDRSRSLETYLFAILRNKLSDHFRRQHGQRQSLEPLDQHEPDSAWVSAESPSRRVSAAEDVAAQRAAVTAALRGWVEQCQQQRRFSELIAVEMLIVLGLRNKEVAADLGITETAVAGVKFRVLERWRQLLQELGGALDFSDADLAQSSTVAQIWAEDGISCLKRSTLGRYLLGALDGEWTDYIEFHLETVGCDRCRANVDDLRAEEQRETTAQRDSFRERCFASSVGFLSQPPPASG